MGRALTSPERALVEALLGMFPEGASLQAELNDRRVETMRDGGMGSLRFIGQGSERFAREVVAAHSVDEDGTPVEISLNLDQNGELYELDIWKVDFSPLQRVPSPLQVKRA